MLEQQQQKTWGFCTKCSEGLRNDCTYWIIQWAI